MPIGIVVAARIYSDFFNGFALEKVEEGDEGQLVLLQKIRDGYVLGSGCFPLGLKWGVQNGAKREMNVSPVGFHECGNVRQMSGGKGSPGIQFFRAIAVLA